MVLDHLVSGCVVVGRSSKGWTSMLCLQGDTERGAAEAAVRGVSHALLRGHAEGKCCQAPRLSRRPPADLIKPVSLSSLLSLIFWMTCF